ncbi:MAG: hypothetical protein R3Y15_06410 [Rikenellaceae bacterium]
MIVLLLYRLRTTTKKSKAPDVWTSEASNSDWCLLFAVWTALELTGKARE